MQTQAHELMVLPGRCGRFGSKSEGEDAESLWRKSTAKIEEGRLDYHHRRLNTPRSIRGPRTGGLSSTVTLAGCGLRVLSHY